MNQNPTTTVKGPSMYSGTNYDPTDSYLIKSPVRNPIIPDHQQRGSAMPFNLPAKLAARSRYDDDMGVDDDETGYVDTDYDEPYDRPVRTKSRKPRTFVDDYEDRPAPRRRQPAPQPMSSRPSRYAPVKPRRRPLPMRRTKLSSLNSVVLNSYPNLGIYKYANPQQQNGFGLKPQPGMLTGGSPGLKNPANAFKTPDFSATPSNVPAPRAGNTPNTNFSANSGVSTTSPRMQSQINMLPDVGKPIVKSIANNIGNNLQKTDFRNIHNQVLKDTHLGAEHLSPGLKLTNAGPFNTLEVNPWAQMNTGTTFTHQDPTQFLDYNRMPSPTYAQRNEFQNPYNEIDGAPYAGVRIKGTF